MPRNCEGARSRSAQRDRGWAKAVLLQGLPPDTCSSSSSQVQKKKKKKDRNQEQAPRNFCVPVPLLECPIIFY